MSLDELNEKPSPKTSAEETCMEESNTDIINAWISVDKEDEKPPSTINSAEEETRSCTPCTEEGTCIGLRRICHNLTTGFCRLINTIVAKLNSQQTFILLSNFYLHIYLHWLLSVIYISFWYI